ncbi:SDR family oxidoreductase [Lichenibacterium dinghuense]|uniref:SDR family oxidoreductase n=1 Tax=Lichenibacterium dinghuense TaxID=2895977 RepID=UPI001F45232A|nr:SDR family oxidoreductase [Lichenibacterium sp. 6Y81]
MRVFLTGATGFIGSRIVPDLIAAGHQVLGLTRSDAGAARLAAAGAEAFRGTLEEPESLRRGAEGADGVIHCAFDHDFSNFAANCEKDRRVIAALGEALRGSDRPLLVTSGVGIGHAGPGEPAVEDNFDPDYPNPRVASEIAAHALLDAGLNVGVVRLPQVHDPVKQGLITPLVEVLREKGVAAYVGDGANRWSAAHVTDVARLYRLALERARPGARHHAVDEEGVPVRDIVAALGRGLGLPVRSVTAAEAPEVFGWMAMFAGLDMAASSARTRAALDWHPTGPGLLTDLAAMDYGAAGR